MTTYNWQYVISGSKPHTKKLTFYFCQGEKIVRDTTDLNHAYQFEQMMIKDGHDFEGPKITDYLEDKTKIIFLPKKEFDKKFKKIESKQKTVFDT